MELISGKITSKGQLTIPVDLRKRLELNEGDRLQFIIDINGDIIVKPIRKKSVKGVIGILRTDKKFEKEQSKDSAQEYVADHYREGLSKND